jgi:dGTPase
VELLENRYPDFPGLNLSHETLEGQRYRSAKQSAHLSPSLETQVVDAADSVAYDSHDADDALELELLDIDQLLAVPMWRSAVDRVRSRNTDNNPVLLRRAVVHELIDWQVKDLLQVSADQLNRIQPKCPEDAKLPEQIICQSIEVSEQKRELESFLMQNIYRHPDVLAVRERAQSALRELFDKLTSHMEYLPTGYRERAETFGDCRSICDYIAGMTDRFAWREHQRLCVH